MNTDRCFFCHSVLIHQAGGGIDWDCDVCEECWDEIQSLGMADRAAVMMEWKKTVAITTAIERVLDSIRRPDDW